ncbi:hypothetical protein RCL1_000670 [Eukaryota sp. TZLM3-RCL]
MDYCAGDSLYDFVIVNKNKLSDTDIWIVFTHLGLGLALLHSHNITHGDLKPSNVVFVSPDVPFQVRILDSKIAGDLEKESARTDKGTHLFMAPEMFTGRPYTTAVDMWSLGVLIYFLIIGNYPNPEDIVSENMFKSCAEFEPLLRRLLVRDASQRLTAAQLLEDEKIVEIYQDFIQEYDAQDVVIFRRELRSLKNEINGLNSFIDRLRCQNCDLKEVILNLNAELTNQKGRIEELESLIPKDSFVSSRQSNLIECSAQRLSLLHRIKAFDVSEEGTDQQKLFELFLKQEEDRVKLVETERKLEEERIAQELQQKEEEFVSNPLVFVCKYPSEVYSRFGNRTKFIPEIKGSRLVLSNNDCLVTSTVDSRANSFVAINHPPNGRITLTLESTRKDGWFCACIGYFNPQECQDRYSYELFTGLEVHRDSLHHQSIFSRKGSCQFNTTSPFSENHSVIISFSDNKATFTTTVYSPWSRTVDCVDGWVFGITLYRNGEVWSIE